MAKPTANEQIEDLHVCLHKTTGFQGWLSLPRGYIHVDVHFFEHLYQNYMKSRVCFTIAKYENDICLLCEPSNAFIDAFCHSKYQISQVA